MKKATKILCTLAVLVLSVALSSCSDNEIAIPQVGDSMDNVENIIKAAKADVDKTSYKNIWILKDYRCLIEFDENDCVKHLVIAGSYDDVYKHTGGYNKIENTNVYTNGQQSICFYSSFLRGTAVYMSAEEGDQVAQAIASGSKQYEEPESIVKDEDAIDEISLSLLRAIWDLV